MEIKTIKIRCDECGYDFLTSELMNGKCSDCLLDDERINEADEINDEDLEAASDMFDRLGDKNDN